MTARFRTMPPRRISGADCFSASTQRTASFNEKVSGEVTSSTSACSELNASFTCLTVACHFSRKPWAGLDVRPPKRCASRSSRLEATSRKFRKRWKCPGSSNSRNASAQETVVFPTPPFPTTKVSLATERLYAGYPLFTAKDTKGAKDHEREPGDTASAQDRKPQVRLSIYSDSFAAFADLCGEPIFRPDRIPPPAANGPT